MHFLAQGDSVRATRNMGIPTSGLPASLRGAEELTDLYVNSHYAAGKDGGRQRPQKKISGSDSPRQQMWRIS
jgi:hypothetical protein